MHTKILFLTLTLVCTSVFAATSALENEAPVITAEQYNEPTNSAENTTLDAASAESFSTASLSTEQRIARLEQLVAPHTSQIQHLQRQVQDLQGRLDEANHQLQALQQTNIKKPEIAAEATTSPTIPKTSNVSKNGIIKVTAVDVPMPTEDASTTSNSSNNLLQEQDIYEKAYRYINQKDYPQAITAMKSYIEQFPRGQYTGNAHYWLGELYMLQQKPDNARAEFKTVIDKFSNNPKAQLASKRLHDIDAKSHAKH